MPVDEPRFKTLENALAALIKLIKAVGYYPPGHPALKTAGAAAHRAFRPLLEGGRDLTLTVRRNGLRLSGEPVAAKNPMVARLAPLLFARRIQQLLLLPDLTVQDLSSFARCLTRDSQEIQHLGGIREVLLRAQVSTIWVNETDLAKILARKEEIEASKGLHGATPEEAPERAETVAAGIVPEKRDLDRVIDELRRTTTDQRYRQLLLELVPLVRLQLGESPPESILRALGLLCKNTSDVTLGKSRRERTLHALNQVLDDQVVAYLLDLLCARDSSEKLRDRVFRVLVFLKQQVVRQVMNRLAEEGEARARKTLSSVLVGQGKAAVPVLTEHLNDPRWYVIRNAVGILGEIRDQESAAHFSPLLYHKEVRVRRETLRALTRIGGKSAIDILLRTVEEADPELRRQALLSLGAIKSPEAVTTLLRLVKRPDLMVHLAEDKKAAIKALGEIGSAEAVPVLTAVLKQRKFLGRTRFDGVRAAAAQALGEIGTPETIPALEAAANGRSTEVARAANQALKNLLKSESDEPPTP